MGIIYKNEQIFDLYWETPVKTSACTLRADAPGRNYSW